MKVRYTRGVNTELLTTAQAAKRLKLTQERVAKMCADGVLPAIRPGVQWLIRSEDFEAFAKKTRKAGRPRKEKAQ